MVAKPVKYRATEFEQASLSSEILLQQVRRP